MEVKALQQMLSQFRQVQEKLEKQIDEISVEASAGGGMVTVKMNGQKQLTESAHRAGQSSRAKTRKCCRSLFSPR